MKAAPSVPLPLTFASDGENSTTIYLDAQKLRAIPSELVSRWAEDAAFASQIRVLSLRSNQLKLLPREIGLLSSLEELYLDYNTLRCWPDEITSLSKLKCLTFEGNEQLKELPPLDCFPELQTLKVTQKVSYHVPPRITKGGPETILNYLQTVLSFHDRTAAHKSIGLSFDSKAHWTPDKDSPDCAECGSKFSVFSWRYHCGLCGRSLCFKDLHPQKVPIPCLSPAPTEVCSSCYRCLNRAAPSFSSPIPKDKKKESTANASGDRYKTQKEKKEREVEEEGTAPDPEELLTKWKKESFDKLKEETQRGINMMKREMNEAKQKEISEMKKKLDVLRAQLVAEKRRKDRGKLQEKIEVEVQLQTELALKKEELSAMEERLANADKVITLLRNKLRKLRESRSDEKPDEPDQQEGGAENSNEATLVALRDALEQAQKEITHQNQQLEELEQVRIEIADKNKNLAALEQELDKLKASAKSTEQSADRQQESQLAALRKERDQAVEAERKKGAAEVARFQAELLENEKRFSQMQRDLQAAWKKLEAAQSEREKAQAELKEEREAKEAKVDETVTKAQSAFKESEAKRKKAEEVAAKAQNELKESEANRAKAQADLKESEAKRIKADETADKAQAELKESEANAEEAAAKFHCELKETKAQRVRAEEAAAKAQTELKESEIKRTKAEEAAAKAQAELKESETKRTKAEEAAAKAQAELKDSEAKRKQIVENTSALQAELKESEAKRKKAAKALKESEARRAQTQLDLEESPQPSRQRSLSDASAIVATSPNESELQLKINNLEKLLDAMRDEVKCAQKAEEEAEKTKAMCMLAVRDLSIKLKEKDNQLSKSRHRMNSRVSMILLGMDQGQGSGMATLHQQLNAKEEEVDEAKAKANEEAQAQVAKVMKLLEEQVKDKKKVKKQLKEARKKLKMQEIEMEKAQAKILLYEEHAANEKRGILSKEKMSLISKIEQLKTRELQLMEELSSFQIQARKRTTSFSHLPLLLPTKAKLLGSTLTPEEADQLKKEKKELKEREKKEKEEKKERKRKEKEEKRLEGKDPRGVLTLRRKGLDKRTPQNPVFGVSLEEFYQKDPSRTIPRIVERLVQFLEGHEVYETEGIFRKSGRNLAIDALRKEFDMAGQGKEDEVPLQEGDNTIHEIAGTLKLFFNMLPEPPLTYELYSSFIALQDTFESLREKEDVNQDYIASLSELLAKLPKPNLALLFYILRFFNKLSKCAEQTKMTSHNLSLIFAPSLCSPEVPTISYQLEMPKLGALVKTMIDELPSIEAATLQQSQAE